VCQSFRPRIATGAKAHRIDYQRYRCRREPTNRSEITRQWHAREFTRMVLARSILGGNTEVLNARIFLHAHEIARTVKTGFLGRRNEAHGIARSYPAARVWVLMCKGLLGMRDATRKRASRGGRVLLPRASFRHWDQGSGGVDGGDLHSASRSIMSVFLRVVSCEWSSKEPRREERK
jgi:hypothetical protein